MNRIDTFIRRYGLLLGLALDVVLWAGALRWVGVL